MFAGQLNISPADAALLGCSESELDAELDAVFAAWNITEPADKMLYARYAASGFDDEFEPFKLEVDDTPEGQHFAKWACGESYNY